MKSQTRTYVLSILAALLVVFTTGDRAAAQLGLDVPDGVRWIWHPTGHATRNAPAGKMYFRGVVNLPQKMPTKLARFIMTADDQCEIFVNGTRLVKKNTGWKNLDSFNVIKNLVPGENLFAVEVTNSGSAAGLVGWVEIIAGDQIKTIGMTDSRWKVSTEVSPDWKTVQFDDSLWAQAKELGPIGISPWGFNLIASQGGFEIAADRESDKPVTPEKARKLIEADWIYQANYRTTPELSLQEIEYARCLVDRFTRHEDKPDFTKELTELASLEEKLSALPPQTTNTTTRELYLAVRRIKRAIMLRNPLLNFDKLLLVDTPNYVGAHESSHRNGHRYRGRNGSRMVVLDGLGPDAKEQVLVPPELGYIMRMDLSPDAQRIVFGMNPTADHSFHLYEINTDGTDLRQLTASDYDDMDPIYLPSGQILFSTSRAHTYVRCLPTSESTVLARCEADGRNIRIISRNNEPDYTPTLLPDGRVLYTRWEYTERPLWRLQKLWTINPDGTEEAVYWGNGSAYPDMLWEARPIPGTKKVMFAAVGHHNVMTGCLGVIDLREGLDWPNGISKVTPELPWPEVGNDPQNNPATSPDYHPSGHFWSYRCPFPLGEKDFLVSAARTSGGRFDLYLMDIDGNRELLYVGLNNSWYARPLRSRTMPVTLPDRVIWPAAGEEPEPGVLFSPNVYDGVEDLPPGSAKYLRVIQMDAKTYSTGYKSWRHSGPVISVIQEDGVKRILGTVPIHPDGSVAFKVPSGQALHFQLLDENQRCIQIMRSFTGVMPGETRGCLGCHALGSASPEARVMPQRAEALQAPPAELTPPPWGAEESISYERFCQPMLDKYCGRCHQGDGEGRKTLDLTLCGGEEERGITDPALLPFKEPYLTLVGPAWNNPMKDGNKPGAGLAGCLNVEYGDRTYGPLKPMTMLSSTSPLIKRVMSGKHHDVKIEGDDLLRLIAWVDCNCVYRGDKEVRAIPDPVATGGYAVPVKIRTAPQINRLQAVSDSLDGIEQ